MKKSILFASILSLSLQSFAGQTEFPKFDDELTKIGIPTIYTVPALDKLISAVSAEIDLLRNVPPEDQKKANDLADRLQTHLQGETMALSTAKSESQRIEGYRNLRSFLYAVRSERLGPVGGSGGAVGNFLSGDLTFPYVAPADRNKAVVQKAVLLEANNLVNTVTGKEYGPNKELYGLTTNEIASLDVTETNSMWHTEANLNQIKKLHGSNWNYIEKSIENAVAAKVPGFSLDKGRRILKLKGIKSSATSPKVETEDLFGQDWKLKWGEEVNLEPLANRLYANLGGKYQDLVYANSGGDKDVILILDKNSPEAQSNVNCSKIATVEKLKTCLLKKDMCLNASCSEKSKYEFDLSPYIIDSKVITEETLNNPNLTFDIAASEDRADLLGRVYLVFNESMVEFQPSKKIAARLGATPLSNSGATEDRAKRGLVLFSYWLNNKDAKDDNNRGVVYENEFIEYMHDLGASLGDIKYSGFINLMQLEFLKLKNPKTLSFPLTVLYRPSSFEKVSFADALWMARKILSLTESDIRSAVQESKWPDFQVENLTAMLLHRRNVIAKVFGEGSEIAPTLDDGPISVDLRSRADRKKAAEKYGITLKTNGNADQAADLIETVMKNAGLKFDSKGNTSYVDKVSITKSGIVKTSKCEESVMISVLEATVRPTGLGRRVQRQNDHAPLPPCAPKKLK